jgi:phosphomannomutase/phosphoglucomutase
MESEPWPEGLDREKAAAVFKAYDIRGIAGDPLTPAFARRLGRSLATFLDCESLAVARDIRESGTELHAAFVEGLLASGVDVHDLGIMPTGALYHATHSLDVDGGVVITASHNPPEYNGFKMCRGTAAMAGEELQELRAVFEAGEFRSGKGEVVKVKDFQERYFDAIIESAGRPRRTVKLVVDSGNAVPGPFVKTILKALGADATCILCDWDNTFPVHPPDPTRPENMELLGKMVVEHGAEFGIGVDGDGDRMGMVDELGNFIHPDRLLALFAADILSRVDEDASDEARTVLFDVKCSISLAETITKHGGIPKMMRTGHSFQKLALREAPDTPMAGEMSGHFFFNDRWPGFDDSLYCIARMLELVAREPAPRRGGRTFSERLAEIPTYPSTGEAKVPLVGERVEVMRFVEESFADFEMVTVDGIRINFQNDEWEGWYLCRPSNTEPILVMRAEATTEEGLAAIRAEVKSRIGLRIDLTKFDEA